MFSYYFSLPFSPYTDLKAWHQDELLQENFNFTKTTCVTCKGPPLGEKSMTIWKICQPHWWVLTLLLLLILSSGWLSHIVRRCASVSTCSEQNGWCSWLIPSKLHSTALPLPLCWYPKQPTCLHSVYWLYHYQNDILILYQLKEMTFYFWKTE